MRGEPWFIYRKEAGRFRAMPVTWQGWAMLLGGIALTVAAVVIVGYMTEGQHLAVRLILAAIVNVAGILGILAVALRKGRPSA